LQRSSSTKVVNASGDNSRRRGARTFVNFGNRLPFDRRGGADCKLQIRFRSEAEMNRRQ
jgi:hypothetical protein